MYIYILIYISIVTLELLGRSCGRTQRMGKSRARCPSCATSRRRPAARPSRPAPLASSARASDTDVGAIGLAFEPLAVIRKG